ncbi:MULTISPECIES: hypothetical protein [unclassified Sphingomonas]|jgi:hypothetical protein|uniref:hypothetical protein n=1 Tax=unclassified Sphingomonas TaxID=196159 RepID=UPI0006F42550|nr:hypothetical protein [Sphingomonas sp. Leaf20]
MDGFNNVRAAHEYRTGLRGIVARLDGFISLPANRTIAQTACGGEQFEWRMTITEVAYLAALAEMDCACARRQIAQVTL